MTLSGNRGSIQFVRTLRTESPGTLNGRFGVGGEDSFSIRLDSGSVGTASSFNLVLSNGILVPFVRQANGTLINAVNAAWQGTVIATSPNNTAAMRLKNGVVYSFGEPYEEFGSPLESITDPNGNAITLTRNPDSLNQITLITDPTGRQLVLSYDNGGFDGEGRIIGVTDPLGRTVSYTYNAAGYLATFTDANGGLWQYGYDTSNNLNTVTDPRGVVVENNTFDGNGRVVSQVQADGSVIQFSYVLWNPTNGYSPVATTTETDQLEQQWVYAFNSQGYMTQVTDPAGNSRVFSLASTNLPLSMTGPGTCPRVCGDPTQGDLSFTYDGNGNQLTRTDSLGDTWTYTYDPVYSKVTTMTDPVGNVTNYEYDGFGNLTAVIDPRGDKTTIGIGAYGLPASITDPMSDTTTLQYDGFGNLASSTDPLSETTTFAYDAVSRLIQTTDPTGARFYQSWDPLDRLVRQTDANGGVTGYTYDPVNDLLTVTDPRGGTNTYTYDNLSREISRTDPLGRQETFGYDPLSDLTSHTDRRGQTSSFGYDVIERLTSETYPDATVARSYDPYSRLLQVTDTQGGAFGFQYDLAGRLLQSTAPAGTITYVRDGDGRATSRQVTGQSAVTYQYDPASNLTQAGMPQATVNMTYDSRNALSTMSRSNGVSSGYTYDPLDRISSIMHQAGSNLLSSFSYSYDPAGNRSAAASSPAQALTTKAATGSFDAANEMNAFGGQTFTYDGNGNRLTQTASGKTTTYTWDGRNRLRSITTPGGQITQFTYDFNANMTQQAVTGGKTTGYLMDDLTNVAAIFGSSAGALSLLTGRGIDAHYAIVTSGGNAQFAVNDALGSVVANSGASATVAGTTLYEPFGQTASAGTTFPFAFTGRVLVTGSIYYYRNRFYDSSSGRFLSEDQIGFRGGDYNLYRYAGNQPVSLSDPSGNVSARVIIICLGLFCREPDGDGIHSHSSPAQIPDPITMPKREESCLEPKRDGP
jgi:RHS repeat-associated protein